MVVAAEPEPEPELVRLALVVRRKSNLLPRDAPGPVPQSLEKSLA